MALDTTVVLGGFRSAGDTTLTVYHVVQDTLSVIAPTSWFIEAGKVLLGAVLAVGTLIVGDWWRILRQNQRQKDRLKHAIRKALRSTEDCAKAIASYPPEHRLRESVFRVLLTRWAAFDRLSDDLRLLREPEFEENVDAFCVAVRLGAEGAIEAEERYDLALGAAEGEITKLRAQRINTMKEWAPIAAGLLERLDTQQHPPHVTARGHASKKNPPQEGKRDGQEE